MEEILDNDSYYPDSKFQAGIALVDTETGAVRALGGGRQNRRWMKMKKLKEASTMQQMRNVNLALRLNRF